MKIKLIHRVSYYMPDKLIKYLVAMLLIFVSVGLTGSCSKPPIENSKEASSTSGTLESNINSDNSSKDVVLPNPDTVGQIPLEELLYTRRSIRDFSGEPITIDNVSQLLWSAQGITGSNNLRTAPSAGALYPLKIYIEINNVDGISSGIYTYDEKNHKINLVKSGEWNNQLSIFALGQTSIRDASVNIIIVAIFDIITSKYGDRGVKYAYIEAGHACQNVLLQAVAINLGAVPIGAFDDQKVSQLLEMNDDETLIYIVPIGKPA